MAVLCIDCCFFVPVRDDEPVCNSATSAVTTVDVVTGDQTQQRPNCSDNRRAGAPCGPEAALFQSKR